MTLGDPISPGLRSFIMGATPQPEPTTGSDTAARVLFELAEVRSELVDLRHLLEQSKPA